MYSRKVHIDMTEMVKTLRQFDIDRGLSKEETLSRAQQAAASRIHYGDATHGGPGAFNFEADYENVKTVTKNKKVGNRASNSVSEKTLAEDDFRVAGNTTLSSYQVEEDETESFESSVRSVAKDDDMDTGGGGKRPAETQTPRRTNATFIGISEMKKVTQEQNSA